MVIATVGFITPHNHFNNDITFRAESYNVMMCSMNDLGGEGIGSFLSNLFSKGMKLYRSAKPYVKSGLQAYKTAKDVAKTAKDIYKSEEVEALKNILPESVKQKEQQVLARVSPFVEKAQELESKALRNYNLAKTVANKIDNEFSPFLPKQSGEGMCGVDKLRNKLIRLENKNPKQLKGYGTSLPGAGTVLAGAGTSLAGMGASSNLQFGLQMLPYVINGISKASKLSGKGKTELMKLTEQTIRPLLPGVRTPTHIASIVSTPLRLIQAGSGKSKNSKGTKLIKSFENDVKKRLKLMKTQKGSGSSTLDVLKTVGEVAGMVLPFLL